MVSIGRIKDLKKIAAVAAFILCALLAVVLLIPAPESAATSPLSGNLNPSESCCECDGHSHTPGEAQDTPCCLLLCQVTTCNATADVARTCPIDNSNCPAGKSTVCGEQICPKNISAEIFKPPQ